MKKIMVIHGYRSNWEYSLYMVNDNGISICITDSIDEVSDVLTKVYNATSSLNKQAI